MISPELKAYIQEKSPMAQEITHPDQLLNFRNENILDNGDAINIVWHLRTDAKQCSNREKYFRLLKECMDLGVDINETTHVLKPLVFSSIGCPPVALFLLENGGYNESFKKYHQNDTDFIIKLLDSPTDVEQIDDKLKILDFLLDKGLFDPNKLTPLSEPLLQIAQVPQLVQWLLDKGCDPYKANKNGQNAIQHHEYFGNKIIVQIFKKHIAQQECLKITSLINQKQNKKLQDEQGDLTTKPKSKKANKNFL